QYPVDRTGPRAAAFQHLLQSAPEPYHLADLLIDPLDLSLHVSESAFLLQYAFLIKDQQAQRFLQGKPVLFNLSDGDQPPQHFFGIVFELEPVAVIIRETDQAHFFIEPDSVPGETRSF